MQDADKNAWNALYDDGAMDITPPDDIPLFYEEPGTLLDWCGRGAACLCGVGASHVMCFAVPAATGLVTGGVGGAIAGAAMYVLSPAFAVAANRGIDRMMNIRRDRAAQIKSTAISIGVSLAVTAGISYAFPHNHIDDDKRAFLDSLEPGRRTAELVVPGQRYGRLPENLRVRVDEAAQEDGLSPAEYLYFCDASDDLGQDIAAFEREAKARRAGTFALD